MAENDSNSKPKDVNDGYIAGIILIVALFLVIGTMVLLWKNKKLLGFDDNSWKTNSFTPPAERENFIVAKARLDVSNPNHLDELKKLLMRRAIGDIPILLNLQNEGNSIERLYKRGMLTDDMHFKVKELKAYVDQEFQEVQAEAEDLVEGWGQNIWPQAMQFHQMIQRQAEEKTVVEDVPSSKQEESVTNKKAPSSTAATSTIEKKKAKKKEVIGEAATQGQGQQLPVPDSEEARAREAERMAKLLLQEEERERNSKKKNNKK